jgi:uncharacterized alkaline shock family protein YloU
MSEHPNQRRLPMGKIEVAPRAIATIAARAVGQSYGVVGMAPHTLAQGVAQVLRREDAHKGVAVRIGDDEIAIDLYVILEYGTRIAEVARNVQEHVRYVVEQALGMPVAQVNVRIQGLRASDTVKG